MEKRFLRLRGLARTLSSVVLTSSIGTFPPSTWSQAPAAPEVTTPTLHVYTNLEQVPTLVLTPTHERMKPIDASKFRVSLDSGPLFMPTHVRLEGDDPISLAVLIDGTAHNEELLSVLQDTGAAVLLSSLRPQDRVSIYAIDCSLIRTGYELKPEVEKLSGALDQAMMPWRIRRQQTDGTPHKRAESSRCQPTMPLWSSMAFVAGELAGQSGRRVLLVVTDGKDGGSVTTWRRVQAVTQANSIAVFGVSSLGMMSKREYETYRKTLEVPRALRMVGNEDPFHLVCELSGGVESSANRKTLVDALQRVISMVRERYVVEFPRGEGDTPGIHLLEVTIAKTTAYVRPVGISVPLADSKILADPATVRSNPASTPQMGNRKVMSPPAN